MSRLDGISGGDIFLAGWEAGFLLILASLALFALGFEEAIWIFAGLSALFFLLGAGLVLWGGERQAVRGRPRGARTGVRVARGGRVARR